MDGGALSGRLADVKKQSPPISIVRARELRRNATDAERRMWTLLREHFGYARFRRQVPIGPFICDFVSHRHRLAIEVDGGQHTEAADAARTQQIEAQGYRVVRFWNSEVTENPGGCCGRLVLFVPPDHPHPAATRQQAAKSSHPSPIEGEEN